MPGPFLPARWTVTSADRVDDPNIFPLLVGQSFLGEKKPVWNTSIATAAAGRERRQSRWSYPRWDFQVSYKVLRTAPGVEDLQRLWAFFNMKAGRGVAFTYMDPSDCVVADATFALGDGTTTAFQLARTTTFGGISYTEIILAPIGDPVVYVNGVETAVTLGAGGIVTFGSAPANYAVLTWSGRFGYLVRFGDDELGAKQLYAYLWSQKGLTLQGIKL